MKLGIAALLHIKVYLKTNLKYFCNVSNTPQIMNNTIKIKSLLFKIGETFIFCHVSMNLWGENILKYYTYFCSMKC